MNSGIKTLPSVALIVEDEEPIADFLSGLLLDVGFKTKIAPTAENAVSLLQERSFDLAFIDLGLPDRSGLELIDDVQRDNPSLPIVISTGYGHRVLQDSIMSQRQVHLLQKPYSPVDVSAVLMECGFHVRRATTAP